MSDQNLELNKDALIAATTKSNISAAQVTKTLMLLKIEQCTVPFITRYRKEATGGLDEEQIRLIEELYDQFIELEKRKTYILESLKQQEVLTKELEAKVLACKDMNVLEDLYAPYKSKKKTKGQLAADKGLAPLASYILEGHSKDEILKKAKDFLAPEKKVESAQDAIEGAKDIIIEKMSHQIEVKNSIREEFWKNGVLSSLKRKDAEKIKDYDKYLDYFEFKSKVDLLKEGKGAHRYLAIRRGVTQKILSAKIEIDEDFSLKLIENFFYPKMPNDHKVILEECAQKAIKNYIHPSLDLELKSELKKLADEHSIHIFGVNLKNLLLGPYLGAKTVMGIDPGVRTGCKTVIVDQSGKLLFDTVIYPHPPQNDIKGTFTIIERLIDHFKVENIAIGNGTFGRETLELIKDMLTKMKSSIVPTLVNESGASIYSASAIAKKEFPDKDATVRGAVSIARRFQDPLAELVKIDPKSIGVGQYQHDVNQAKLKKSLTGVVEDCVNFVGVNVNTASSPLLSYISGIGPSLADSIVQQREKLGRFKSRKDLLKISRFSEKIFQQAGGFLRIMNGDHPLDATFIHPEQYPFIEQWCKEKGISIKDLKEDSKRVLELEKDQSFKEKVGDFTHADIVKALKNPIQDPRSEFQGPNFRSDIKTISDLEENQWYPGVVTNITHFGAFVDIGIKENGLLHVSQISEKFIENPLSELSIGQEVNARVIEVDSDRKRISLSLKKHDKNEEGYKQKTSGNSNHKPKKKPQAANAPLKNNAFSALKNFKVK